MHGGSRRRHRKEGRWGGEGTPVATGWSDAPSHGPLFFSLFLSLVLFAPPVTCLWAGIVALPRSVRVAVQSLASATWPGGPDVARWRCALRSQEFNSIRGNAREGVSGEKGIGKWRKEERTVIAP